MSTSAAQDFAERVAATFGEKPRWHGREARTRCALHEATGAHQPSFAIWDRGAGKIGMRCLTGCPLPLVKEALRARGIALGTGGPVSVEAQHAARQAEETCRVEQLTKARDALVAAKLVAVGDAADVYLKSRALDLHSGNFANSGTLLCGPDPSYKGGIAMLGVICDLTTYNRAHPRATGIMSLSLNNDGTPRLEPKSGKKFRSIVGTQKGYGVPFGTPGPHLVVAEGVETMLAAMRLLEVPFGVASLSASNMAALAVPEYVRKITISADNDEPGVMAAKALRENLVGTGVDVGIELWGPLGSGHDAADEWMKRSTTNGA